MNISSHIDYAGNRFLMFAMDDMANQKEYGDGEEVIRLTLGKSEKPPHEEIVQEMCSALMDPVKSSLVYPAGLPQLQQALSTKYREMYGVDIPAHRFIISPGTSVMYRNLFALLAKQGDEILLPHPYYSLYHFCGLLTGATIKYYNIDPLSGKLDMDSFVNNFSERTKLIVINSPGNPLGNVLSDNDIRKMDSVANGRAVFICDEIYANTYFDEAPRSIVTMADTKSLFIPTNAFSKAYRMYARRVGYCIAPEELVTPLTVIQHHTLLTVDPIVQFGAIAALKRPQDVEELVSQYRQRRNYTMEKLSAIPLIRPTYSAGGFYISIVCDEFMKKYHYHNSYELAKRIFEETNVAVVPGSDFGIDRTIRLSFTNERYCEGIDRLQQFFLSHKA